MIARGAAAATVIGLIGLITACTDEHPTVSLTVQVRTDYTPGRDFASVRATVVVPGQDSGAIREEATTSFDAVEGDDFFTAPRLIGEIAGLAPGQVRVVVTLVSVTGNVVGGRTVSVDLSSSATVSVLITQTCRHVVCPTATEGLSATTCSAGRCVDLACSIERADLCGEPMCATAMECPAVRARCGERMCVEGMCLYLAHHEACAAGERCDLDRGCEAIVPIDAGPADAGPMPADAAMDAPPIDAPPAIDAELPDAGEIVPDAIAAGG